MARVRPENFRAWKPGDAMVNFGELTVSQRCPDCQSTSLAKGGDYRGLNRPQDTRMGSRIRGKPLHDSDEEDDAFHDADYDLSEGHAGGKQDPLHENVYREESDFRVSREEFDEWADEVLELLGLDKAARGKLAYKVKIPGVGSEKVSIREKLKAGMGGSPPVDEKTYGRRDDDSEEYEGQGYVRVRVPKGTGRLLTAAGLTLSDGEEDGGGEEEESPKRVLKAFAQEFDQRMSRIERMALAKGLSLQKSVSPSRSGDPDLLESANRWAKSRGS